MVWVHTVYLFGTLNATIFLRFQNSYEKVQLKNALFAVKWKHTNTFIKVQKKNETENSPRNKYKDN